MATFGEEKSTSNCMASKEERLAMLEDHFQKDLPTILRPALQYLITGEKDEIAAVAASECEERRAAIAAEGEKKVPIWYSPKPGSAGQEVLDDMKPFPGKVLELTMERISRIGKNERWGTVLHLLVREFKGRRGIELGACVGISALYLSSAGSVERLITVEGSEELSCIARESVKNRPQVTVVNSLFDEAIDNEVSHDPDLFDFVYIDGHHEKIATIHYFNRLTPFLRKGALVIFDDISWSSDMREAWDILSKREEFVHAVDLGSIGVCFIRSNEPHSLASRVWDLRPITGKRSIGKPFGWRM